MKSKEIRELLLRKYIKEIEQLHIKFPDGYDDGGKGTYICPLCLKVFNIGQIGEQINSYITIEHVPPKNLGGKPLVLTCKECNSVCGHEIDVYLRNEIENSDKVYFNGAKGHFSKYGQGGAEVNAITNEDKEGIIDIRIERKRNSPINFDTFAESIKNSTDNLHIHGHLILGDHRRSPKMACVALLKSAYLFAFYRLGYQYVLTTKLNAIREQILHPEKEIIPPQYICLYADDIDGNRQDDIYVATIDTVKVFAVLLTLKLPKSNYLHRFISILPYIDDNDVDLYNRLKNLHTAKETIEVQFRGFARIRQKTGE